MRFAFVPTGSEVDPEPASRNPENGLDAGRFAGEPTRGLRGETPLWVLRQPQEHGNERKRGALPD